MCARVFVSSLNVAPSTPLRSPPLPLSTRTLLASRPALAMLFCVCEWPTVDGMSKCECVCMRARACDRVSDRDGPSEGTDGDNNRGKRWKKWGDGWREERGGGKGLAWTLVLNKVALKAKFIKAYPHDTRSASCLGVKGGIRERVEPREDGGEDIRKGRKKGLRRDGYKT